MVWLDTWFCSGAVVLFWLGSLAVLVEFFPALASALQQRILEMGCVVWVDLVWLVCFVLLWFGVVLLFCFGLAVLLW